MSKNEPAGSGNSVPYRGLGKPEGPSWEVWKEGRVLVVSIFFCGAAVIAVSLPQAAFWLGSRGNLQLIIVGLAISLMNYCFEIEARALILVMEACFGRSTLQNFESILYNSLFIKHAHRYMQLVILLLSAFPLSLSVAYKAFNNGETYIGDPGWLLNGQSTSHYTHNNTYGLSNPLLDNRTTVIMIYATEPVVTLDTTYPLELGSYGLNMQVLNDNTTAMLDPPTRDFLQSLRNDMRPGQTVYLRASVNATFSSVNCTNADNSCRRPAGFLDSTSPSHAAWVSTVNVAGAGNIKFTMAADKAQQEVLFISAWDESAYPPTSINSELIGFNLYRGHCDGRWRVNKTTVLLEEASRCMLSDFSTSQRLITENSDWASLWNLQQVLADAIVTASDDPIPAILPTDFSAQSAIVASMVWSKLSFDATFSSHYPELNYGTESRLRASVPTLKRHVLLYVVICIQPVMIIRHRLRHIPVSNKFGLVSLLAGIHSNSVRLLKGASFSGILNGPVGVTINVVEDGEADEHRSGHLEYILNTEKGSKSGLLVKGVTYY